MSKFLAEMARFLITGALTFIASLTYAEWRFRPDHNFEIVPIVARPHELCTVDRERVKQDPLSAQDAAFNAAVEALREGKQKVVSEDLFDEHLRKALQKAKYLTCASSTNDATIQLFGTRTPVTIEAFANIRSSAFYALDERCTLVVGDRRFPVVVSTPEAALARSLTRGKNNVLVLNQPTQLRLFYPGSNKSEELNQKFRFFVSSIVNNEEIAIRLLCDVIHDGRRVEVGSDVEYVLRGGRFHASRRPEIDVVTATP